MACLGKLPADRHNLLGIEHEAAFLQGPLQTRHPFHLAPSHGNFTIVRPIQLDAVAALVFCHVASSVSCTKDIGQAQHAVCNLHDANARSDTECFSLAYEAKIGYAKTQFIGDANGLLHRTIFQQYTKFVPAQTCERISLADLLLQEGTYLPQ